MGVCHLLGSSPTTETLHGNFGPWEARLWSHRGSGGVWTTPIALWEPWGTPWMPTRCISIEKHMVKKVTFKIHVKTHGF